jgi:AraC-like DNA-binding protein
MLTLKSPINSDLLNYKLTQFKKVLAFIQANYNKKITILDMANEINMSQYYFCRFFKKMSGSTPFEYLVNYRINEAEKLLSTTNKKIFDIALEVGFDTVSYFIKTFKKIKKNTPSKFREAYMKR